RKKLRFLLACELKKQRVTHLDGAPLQRATRLVFLSNGGNFYFLPWKKQFPPLEILFSKPGKFLEN
uniref:hypothetical protein n=1 Tax=uncultured Porphyromonas sp. TaxID=159274 RepID=UPI00261F94E3